MHIYSPTEKVGLLLCFKDARGVFQFLYQDEKLPGLFFSAKGRVPIIDQILDFTTRTLGFSCTAQNTDIIHNYKDELLVENKPCTLYLASIRNVFESLPISHKPMPQLIRPIVGKNRLIYLRAWQVFMGGLTQETKVLETLS